VNCKNNLRSLAQGMISYSNDNKGCLPGNAHDNPAERLDKRDFRWMQIVGPPTVDPPKVQGLLAEYVENNQETYLCPTFKGAEETGGDQALCHYAIPTLMSGLPVGLIREAYYYHPLTATDPGSRRMLGGAPMVVEPDPAALGTFIQASRTWNPVPDGAFEGTDKLAARRHMGKTCMAFHDGHVEDVEFPDPEIKAENIFIVLNGLGERPNPNAEPDPKTLHLGGENKMDNWLERKN